MAGWSQSHFLQSLGWATLNSFWQMALLWSIYTGACFLLKLPAYRKYQIAVGSVLAGFIWFVLSFVTFYQNSAGSSFTFIHNGIYQSNGLLNIFLVSASIAY